MDEINREMYEFKVKYKSRTGYMVRTFCNNPSGFVVTENYGDFTTVNRHAKMREKAGIPTLPFWHHIANRTVQRSIGYGSYIAKLSNLLAGEGK